MERRAFMSALTGGLLAAPLMAEAQQARVYRIGVVLQGGPYFADIDGLRDGLKELGLVEGKHFVLDVRDTKGDLTVVESAARALEERKVDLIYSITTSVTLAVKLATKSVTIVLPDAPGLRSGRPALSALCRPDGADRHHRRPHGHSPDPRTSRAAGCTRRPRVRGRSVSTARRPARAPLRAAVVMVPARRPGRSSARNPRRAMMSG